MSKVAMSKWVEIEDLEQPAATVAAEILRMRIEPIQQTLPLAAHQYREDIEHMHRLRVSCRRAGAAVQAFQPLLKSNSKRLRNGLQKLRRAAGPARDADVLLERLLATPDDRPCQAYVVARLKKQRKQAQRGLLKRTKQAKSGRLDKSVERCLSALQKKASKKAPSSFRQFASEALRLSSQRMFRFAGQQQATQQQASVAELHQLRIAGKRLRYSIELFHNVFPDTLQTEVYPIVEEIQSRLGQLNDHATAQAIYQHWLVDLPPSERAAQIAARVVEEYEATKQVRGNFLHWWTPQRVTALESHLDGLIRGQ